MAPSQSMKVKPGMSDYQKKTMLNQVREGETQNSGEKNRHRRVKEIDEIKELAIMLLRIKQRKRKECDQH
jgi:hypothetical protein